jgi:holo-[acyl-carrier protein] synthase
VIKGVGIDMVEVERLAEKLERSAELKSKVFSEAEIKFCEAQQDKGQHYGARFAAKEAFLKATGKGLTLGHNLSDIEVVSDTLGKPMINLKGTFAAQAVENKWNTIHVSLTHVKSMASAVVIIEE